MSRTSVRATALATAALMLTGVGLVTAPAASAEEFADFTATPNRSSAPVGTPIVIKGRTAASWDQGGPVYPGPGTPMCLFRKVKNGYYQVLDICTVVNKNRTFTLQAYLGRVGTYTYTVADNSEGAKPGTVVSTDDMAMAKAFRLTTTG